jgi:hypothetical protein
VGKVKLTPYLESVDFSEFVPNAGIGDGGEPGAFLRLMVIVLGELGAP